MLFTSRKPEAQVFRDWVMDVIEILRQNGRYELANLDEPDVPKRIKSDEEKTRQIQLEATHNALLSAFAGRDRYVNYIGKIRDEPNDRMLIKIGKSKNIKQRSTELVKTFGSFFFMKVYDCSMNDHFETYLQKHSSILPLAYREVIHNGHRSNGEVFSMTKEQLDKLFVIVTRNLHRFEKNVLDDLVGNEMQAMQDTIDITKQLHDDKNLMLDQSEQDKERLKRESDAEVENLKRELKIERVMTTIAADSARKYTLARGNKVQRYSADGKTLLCTYEGTTEACRDQSLPRCNQLGIREASKQKSLYKGYRWYELSRALPDDTVQDIGETVTDIRTNPNNGLVAMLDIKKEMIVKVYRDQKEAGKDRNFKSAAAVCMAIKMNRLSSGHYFKMWHECDETLMDDYLITRGHTLPEPRPRANGKSVFQVHPVTKAVVKEFSSVADVIKDMRISRRSLFTAIECKTFVKGFMWRMVGGDVDETQPTNDFSDSEGEDEMAV